FPVHLRETGHAPSVPSRDRPNSALRSSRRQGFVPVRSVYFAAVVASFTHFFTKLDFAAPANFFSVAWVLQAVVAASVASLSHFLIKLDLAAPASFFSAACASQDGLAANAAVLANRVIAMKTRNLFMTHPFMFGVNIGRRGRSANLATRLSNSHMVRGSGPKADMAISFDGRAVQLVATGGASLTLRNPAQALRMPSI